MPIYNLILLLVSITVTSIFVTIKASISFGPLQDKLLGTAVLPDACFTAIITNVVGAAATLEARATDF